MSEYIKREALLDNIRMDTAPFSVAMVFRHIHNAPATDVEPVRRGEWIEDDYAFNRCSECGYEFDSPEIKTPYCPNCGAKMDNEEDDP